MAELIWADQAGVPVDDRGLAYGDGLFETIRVSAGRATLVERHCQRLVSGAQRLDISLASAELGAAIDQACQRWRRPDDWVLKLVMTRGSGGRGYRPPDTAAPRLIASAHAMPPLPPAEGVTACISPIQLWVNPALAGLKSLARLEQVLASRAMAPDCYEALMTDHGGHLLEGTRTNLMLWLGDHWLTPAADTLAVAGVMRERLIDHLRGGGEPVREGPVTMDLLASSRCRGLVLMNSVVGVVPVRSVNSLRLPVGDRLATIISQDLFTE